MSDPNAYVILIGPSPDGGHGAWAPDLPGCIALGDTVEDTEREMREAIAFYLDGLRRDGFPHPLPKTVSATVPWLRDRLIYDGWARGRDAIRSSITCSAATISPILRFTRRGPSSDDVFAPG